MSTDGTAALDQGDDQARDAEGRPEGAEEPRVIPIHPQIVLPPYGRIHKPMLCQFLDNFLEPDVGCMELRVLDANWDRSNFIVPGTKFKSTYSGWYCRQDAIIVDVNRLKGVSAYVTLNPVRLDLMARSDTLIKSDDATKDVDIVRWDRTLIDCDAVRPKGISSTDAERAAALSRRDAILGDFPEFELTSDWGCSGNGGFIMPYLPGYPNNAEHAALIAHLIDGMSMRYSDSVVHVDPTTKNASRVGPLPGSWKCKGVNCRARPHRLATLDSPARKPVPLEIREILDRLPKPANKPSPKAKAVNVPIGTNGKPETQARSATPSNPEADAIVAGLSDEELLDRARRSEQGAKVIALHDQGNTGGYVSPSEAEFAYFMIMSFWTRGDSDRIRRLYDASALGGREKYQDRTDQPERSIAKAIAATTDFYTPSNYKPGEGRAAVAGLFGITIDDAANGQPHGTGTDGTTEPPQWATIPFDTLLHCHDRPDQEDNFGYAQEDFGDSVLVRFRPGEQYQTDVTIHKRDLTYYDGRPLTEPPSSGQGAGAGDVDFASMSNEDLGLFSAVDIKVRAVDWLWQHRLALGSAAMFAAEGGAGKTLLALYMAAQVTVGGPWPDGSGNAPIGDVIILSAEDQPEDTLKPRLLALGADMARVKFLKARVIIKREGKEPQIAYKSFQDRDYWQEIMRRVPNCRMFVVDPLPAYLGRGVNDHRNNEVRAVMEPFIQTVIEPWKCVMLCISHLGKSVDARTPQNRILGSVAYSNLPRNVHVVFKDQEVEGRRIFGQVKCNNAPDNLPSLAFRVAMKSIDFDGEVIETAIPEFEAEPVTIDVQRAMATNSKPGPKPATALAEWLFDFLHGLPQPEPLGRIFAAAGADGLLGKQKDDGKWSNGTALYNAQKRVADLPAPRAGYVVEVTEVERTHSPGRPLVHWSLAYQKGEADDTPF
jgi:AAA domain